MLIGLCMIWRVITNPFRGKVIIKSRDDFIVRVSTNVSVLVCAELNAEDPRRTIFTDQIHSYDGPGADCGIKLADASDSASAIKIISDYFEWVGETYEFSK